MRDDARKLTRRLVQAAVFAFVRSAAVAAGSGSVAVLIWWIEHH